MRSILTSYVPAGPEQKDLHGVKRCVLNSALCPSCNIENEKFNELNFGTLRTISDTEQLLMKVKNNLLLTKLETRSKSPLGVQPVRTLFPFSLSHPVLDLYQIFRFELPHNLSLVISKILKKCLCDILNDSCTVTSSMHNKSKKPQRYNNVRRTILKTLNIFLETVEKKVLAMDCAFCIEAVSLKVPWKDFRWVGYC